MYSILLPIHSGLRYLVLFFLIFAVVKPFAGWLGNRPFSNGDRKIALFALIFTHIQVLIGLILYFMSPTVTQALGDMGSAMKDGDLRFWAVEHIAGMLLAAILITIGYSKAKKKLNTVSGNKTIAILFLISLLVIFMMIPWPFTNPARPWF